MRILVAGASGAIGRALVPMLVAHGHDVVGTTRTADKVDLIEGLGARAVVADALDRAQVVSAVADAKPDVVVHQLTAINGPTNLRDFDGYFAATNRLRTEGTDHLLAAARAAGVRRFVAQSYAGWPSGHGGPSITTEADPLDEHPTAHSERTLAAIRHVEEAVTAAPLEGVVLRYGSLYGPGNAVGTGGEVVELIRRRRMPVVGNGNGVWSFIHVDDAAAATVIAVEGGPVGRYNIVDDEPAPVREWLPYLASVIGARPPFRVPAWLVKPLLGEHGVAMMTQIRGAANTRARTELGWVPMYPSWRQGFREGLS